MSITRSFRGREQQVNRFPAEPANVAYGLARRRQARRRDGEVDVGGADYEDAGHSRSKNSARKRSASTTCATRQFGAPAARRV